MASLVPASASIHDRPSWIISPYTATSPTTIAVHNSIHNRPRTKLRGFQTLAGSKPSRPSSAGRSRAHSEVIDTMPQVREGEASNSVMQPQSEKTDIYANISTIPISASLIGSGVDASELTGRVCNIADRPHKKQVQFHFIKYIDNFIEEWWLGDMATGIDRKLAISCRYVCSIVMRRRIWLDALLRKLTQLS